MNALTSIPSARGLRVPIWYWTLAVLCLLWNIYGIYQYVGSLSRGAENLMAMGMTREQAQIYLGLPTWISVAFAVGVFGGTIGCVLLLLRRAAALPVLAASFAGYVALFAGDVFYGVFEAIPAQLAILVVVVLVAAILLAAAWVARLRGLTN